MASREETPAVVAAEAEAAARELFRDLPFEEVVRLVLMRMRELVEIGDPGDPEELGIRG